MIKARRNSLRYKYNDDDLNNEDVEKTGGVGYRKLRMEQEWPNHAILMATGCQSLTWWVHRWWIMERISREQNQGNEKFVRNPNRQLKGEGRNSLKCLYDNY
ncbi:hypothetical protein TNCV_4104521 [Trichonephila clavipes]|nr:hypothetical protein TNCV_4104521 [Trichonephila clavipes]